jgi:sodium-dependent dicarboxylate transporter 2/3/5
MITKEQISRTGLITGPALFALAISIPMDGLAFEAKVVLASALWMGTWWITEAIPIYATALLPLVLFPAFNVASLVQLSASYADKIVFLFLGGFMIAAAVQRSGLHERFALGAIRTFGASPRSIVGGFMITTGMLSAWISNTATAMMMLPIAASIIAQVRKEDDRARFGTCLMLCIAYSASIGGLATLLGTPPNAVFASLSKSLVNVEVSFGQWMLIGVPISAVSLAFAWWYMVNFGAKIGKEPIAEEKRIILERLRQLGALTRQEKTVAIIFGATAIAWISRGLVWGKFVPMIDDSIIAIIAALSLFVIPSGKGQRALDWHSAAKIPWGVLLLMGGGLALASGFTLTGLDKWIAEQLILVETSDTPLIIPLIASFTIFTGEIISNTAGAALIIPIGASVANSLSINPIMLMLPVALASSFNFILPVGTPPNAIVYGSGYVTTRQMAKAGLPLDLFGIGIVALTTLILVPIVFG